MTWKFRLVNTAIMAFFLSGLMTMYITYLNLGLVEDFVHHWLHAWVLAAPAAFTCVITLSIPVQRLTQHLLER